MRHARIAVVGSGPAGLYTADELLRQDSVPASVDIFDRLPTPFGLLRYGVAPDHPKMKSLAVQLQQILDRPGVRFFGNVRVGEDLPVHDLRENYDAVVYSFGAALDRKLGIPGEDIGGHVSATRFVAWYSGHPDIIEPPCSLDTTSAVVIGAGNVALDVARILSKQVEDLKTTDIPDIVLDRLSASEITDVHILARRGPQHVKFTLKELKELGELDDVDVVVRPEELVLDAEAEQFLESAPAAARNMAVFRDWASRPLRGTRRRIHFRFHTRPLEIHGGDACTGLTVQSGPGTSDTAPLTETIPAGLIVHAIGYRGTPVPDVPFDEQTGTIPTDGAGRVLRDGTATTREYAAGWIKRGPTGVLGTNRADAAETVRSIVTDLTSRDATEVGDFGWDPADRLAERGICIVDREGWNAIDLAEVELGRSQGRPRTKIAELNALLAAGRASLPTPG